MEYKMTRQQNDEYLRHGVSHILNREVNDLEWAVLKVEWKAFSLNPQAYVHCAPLVNHYLDKLY